MRRALLALLTVALLTSAGYAVAQSGDNGRIGPASRIQPNGRKLDPAGHLTKVGNHPAGGALTPDGRFYWTLSAGRGRNDIRILKARTGKVVQVLPMPGLSGGIAMAPDGQTAYVSGLKESSHTDEQSPADTPGKQGDVVHVLSYDPHTGVASRSRIIPLPAPADAPAPQAFPPNPNGPRKSWPRDLAVSPDGKTLLAALNLADSAALVDTATGQARFVKTGSYPYGAAITRDGKYGLVSNEASGTVSVIDLAAGTKLKDIQVGPHLSHPEGIKVDPKRDRAYVAVTHQDLIAVIDTQAWSVERTLSVEQPAGIGTAPVALNVTRDGCFLLSADSGEDALAVFALPDEKGKTCRNGPGEGRSDRAQLADAIIRHEAAGGAAQKHSRAWQLVGRIPVAAYPVDVDSSPDRHRIVWLTAKGLGVGPNPNGPNPLSPNDSDNNINSFQYLPSIVTGQAGVLNFPSDRELARLTPRAARQLRPLNFKDAPPGTPLRADGPIKHVFYIVRENRTYDQMLGDDPRGDGDPKLTLFGQRVTPNAHALVKRFPLLDHVYANSEASIDGHFWTAAGSVSDYVTKNWHQNYAGRGRPYDFGVYTVTWPAARFLFDQAEKQSLPYYNFGEAVAGDIPIFPDKDRQPVDLAAANAKFAKSDLGAPFGCFPNDASIGKSVLTGHEVYDTSPPAGSPAGSESRLDCFRTKFNAQLASNSVPALSYLTLSNDHTEGTTPGRRTPNAMIAENDYALGQIVETISHSSVWNSSLILVVEDDSQDGADHVDAHRIPALAISPYTRRGAVVHTRYDFLSFIRTLELPIGMKPLNLFDTLALPMYDAFGSQPSNNEPFNATPPNVDLNERNTAASPNAAASKALNLSTTDQVPQRTLDRILWQYRHGAHSAPPPPGPNASGKD